MIDTAAAPATRTAPARRASREFLPPVSTCYGAPMGRACYGTPEHAAPDTENGPGLIRLFRVPLDSGGYDSGGACWGLGTPLYCATDGANYRQFTRASTREAAALALEIPPAYLARPLKRPALARYCLAVIEGRAPAVPGMNTRDLFEYMRAAGIDAGDGRQHAGTYGPRPSRR